MILAIHIPPEYIKTHGYGYLGFSSLNISLNTSQNANIRYTADNIEGLQIPDTNNKPTQTSSILE
jgi:hypothetical protein